MKPGISRCSHFFSQIQIIWLHYRPNLSQFQIGCTMLSLITMQLACLYNSISFLSGKNTGGPIWYHLFCAWCEFVLVNLTVFVFSILADVYNVSNAVLKKIKGRTELKRNPWLSRWIKSCPTFKVYFGGSNYLDRLIPLNIQNFIVIQTISLVLSHN